MSEKTKASDEIRVLLVEDHPLFRQGLALLLNQEEDLVVCGEAADAKMALKLIGEVSPNFIIVDISLKDSSGIDLIKSIKALHPDLFILVVSMHDENLFAERAIRAGAHGYVMKREAAESVMAAIRTILSGEVYLSEAVRKRSAVDNTSEGEGASPVELLSDREFEVFQLLGQGFTPRQIAQQLHLSIRTIEAHREHIKKKMSIDSAVDLLKYAIQWVQAERGD